MLAPGDRDRAALDLPQAGDRVDQLASGRCRRRRRCRRSRPPGRRTRRRAPSRCPRSSTDVEVVDREQHVARLRRRLLDAEQHVAADHRARERLLGRALARHRLDRLAAPQHGDPVGDLEHLVQLVADEDDRLAVRLQAADDLEELARLLRRQHRGRLVEDQDVGAAVERLQDLDALLLADGDVADERGRVDGEPELLGELAHAPLGRALVEQAIRRVGSTPSTMFSATVITGISMKCWCTIPIPAPIASRAERERDGLAVQQDLARVRPVEAVEDVHQRRLAGAVLAEQRVHLAAADVEVDVVVGDDARELLRMPRISRTSSSATCRDPNAEDRRAGSRPALRHIVNRLR